MSVIRNHSKPQVQRPGAAGRFTGNECLCFNHAPYDGFGNLTAKVLNGTTNAIAVNAATNQLTNAIYDANGNMTSGAGATLTYDYANRVATAQEVSGGREYYGYDGGNKRLYRVTSGGQEQFIFYGARGEKLGVYNVAYDNTCAYPVDCPTTPVAVNTSIWFAGRLIMDAGAQAAQDRTGTNRAEGARFYPYGDEITSTSNDRTKFGTYTRDSYSGLDYADQRYYASSYGRFLTPDPKPKSARLRNPQSWNRYSYVLGDPINRFDPGGIIDEDCDVFCDDLGGGGDDAGGDVGNSGAGDGGSSDGSCIDNGDGTYSCGQTFTDTGTGSPDPSSGDSASSGPPDPEPAPQPGPISGPTDPGGPAGPAAPSAPSGPGKSGRRSLSPSSQECMDLAKKISNVQRDIAEMTNNINVNPSDLPPIGPGNTVASHVWDLVGAQANLTRLLALYAAKCGGGPPPPVPVRAPRINPPGVKWPIAPIIPKPSPISIGIGVGVGGLGACFASGFCWVPIIAIP